MFAQLPESIKQQVMRYLQMDDFPAAKELYDDYKNSYNERQIQLETPEKIANPI